MSRQPEGRLIAKLQAYAASRGAYCVKIHGDEFQAITLDLLVCYRGTFIGAEAKQPGRNATRKQQQVIRRITEAEGVAGTVHSVEEFTDLFDEADLRGKR